MPDFDITTVIFAAIAIFVVWRLRSVLGTRNGAERPPFDPSANVGPRRDPVGDAQPMGQVVRMPTIVTAAPRVDAPPTPSASRWEGFAAQGSPAAAGLDAIAAADPSFDPAQFLAGARAAYGMIVTAFAAGDTRTLQSLLAPDVFENFSHAIDARRAKGETLETTIVSIDSTEIEDAGVSGGVAHIAVRFASKLASRVRDSKGIMPENATDAAVDHLDIWTFSRQTGSRDPNWRLSATETVH